MECLKVNMPSCSGLPLFILIFNLTVWTYSLHPVRSSLVFGSTLSRTTDGGRIIMRKHHMFFGTSEWDALKYV